MDQLNDLSSSLSFASSYLSNGSSGNHVSASAISQSTEHLSLSRLSDNLERLLLDSEYDYSDADIVVEGVKVGVNRCILAARSQYFHELFKKGNDDSKKEGKPQYMMSELVPHGGVGCEAFKVVLNYLYTGKLKPPPPEVSTVSTCVDDGCPHDSCGPAINYAVELMYAAATFQMKEIVQVVQRRLTNFVEKALVEDVIPILVASFYCDQKQLFSHCIERVARSDLDNVILEKELPHEIFYSIKSLRLESQQLDDAILVEMEPLEDKRLKGIRNLHMALDSDDVELLKLLLDEPGSVTLDDAYALHYAVAYCDPKIVKEVLGLQLGNTNLRNARGHTVLHVAARRKEPAVLVPLLNSGASALERTLDGQTAVAICRRLTRPKDYHENTMTGQVSNKDRICIDLLEREMKRNSKAVNMSNTSQVINDDLNAKLDYFENRVAFARLLFPAEAKLAMEMADHPKSGYSGLASKGSSGNLREVDLNETPSVRSKRLKEKLQALIKTVEMGRRFFPHCSEVLDKFLEDEMDMADYILEKGTPEEQQNKKMRFLELKDDVQKAFSRDVAEKQGSVLTASSSSSSSPKEGKGQVNRKVRKR
ncbi:BTB/POZ domain and ankyrin repeat-containing protein NPR1-like [Argentina anserina]|uniref:BTB/POZ domain and ankyrin repeat-containing protein NPR1-like n=1 Tax=Argentina anserina TaxID=57926 RepID=UPI0021766EE1|nr:BTB/POZ domain and ankyrin repeat-containing protein NPR1-like [Potentilla anserina]XP_050380232.1 BTB/POZ domain and ankyrin repeat-containing protein NPR1-like [Potentilla anserina]XP_050380233.1 BTB/POZ domain and ankyrin repeat-containing protein NPR1-like [Potentilla anserina]